MRVTLSALLILLLVTISSQAGPPISGIWTLEDSPVVLEDPVSVVPMGETLTIEAGVRVLFHEDCRLEILGQLNVVGTEESPVVFTSYTQNGIWQGIVVHGSSGGPSSSFSYAHILNANIGLTGIAGVITLNSCNVVSEHYALSLRDGARGELRKSSFSVSSQSSNAKTVSGVRLRIVQRRKGARLFRAVCRRPVVLVRMPFVCWHVTTTC